MASSSDNQQASGAASSRNRPAGAFEAARERTASAYEAARRSAGDVTRQASAQMATYPVAAVIGGFAVGALLGVLLPRSAREESLLGPAGRRLTGAAREAAQKGLDAGREQIDEIRNRAAQKVGEAVTEAVADVVAGKS
jgi:ElaB/YqjD/DUF883 family membrane-anchored ribosome-binding protein